MSIDDLVGNLIESKQLRVLEPLMPGDIRRHMLISPEVQALIDGPWPTVAWERRCSRLRADLETFVRGDLVSLSLTPFAAGAAYLGLLAPPRDGIWDIRSRDPSPAMRVLGGFLCRDTFVALLPAARSVPCEFLQRGPLGDRDSPEWRSAILECKAEWRRLFLGFRPTQGVSGDEFVGAPSYVV